MKKVLSFVLTLALLLVPCVSLADMESAGALARERADALPESERVVNVFTWTYYIPDEVVAAFEEASGIRVNYSPFSTCEEMHAKLLSTPGQYDLVICSDYIIATMAEGDLLAEVDASRLTNYANIDPAYQGQYYDPDNRYTIPYDNTVPLIVYDPEQVDFEVTGYADLWREEFSKNLVLLDDMRTVIAMAEKKLGLSCNETDPEKLSAVRDELLALKDNVTVYNADTPHNSLLGGDAIAGVMFGSQIVAAQAEKPQLKVVYPAEGMLMGVDCIVLPKDGPHADATYILLDYLLDGEVSAYASSLINYGSCNTAAQEYLPEDFKANEAVNVPSEALADAEMLKPLDNEAQRLYDDLWTALRG